MVRLKRNVASNLKPSFIYGFAGDILNVIAEHGNMTVVENVKTGYRFHAPTDALEEYVPPAEPVKDQPKIITDEPVTSKPIINKVKATKKKLPPPQNTLF